METDYFVCSVCCQKKFKENRSKYLEHLDLCDKHNAYLVNGHRHYIALDSVSPSAIVILRLNRRYLAYGEIKGFPREEKIKELNGARIRMIDVDVWFWKNPEEHSDVSKMDKSEKISDNVIVGKRGDKVKKIKPEYAVKIIEWINSDRQKHKK